MCTRVLLFETNYSNLIKIQEFLNLLDFVNYQVVSDYEIAMKSISYHSSRPDLIICNAAILSIEQKVVFLNKAKLSSISLLWIETSNIDGLIKINLSDNFH